MRLILNRPLLGLAAAIMVFAGLGSVPHSPARAQGGEELAEDVIGAADNAANIAEQIARQGGRIGGRTGMRVGSATSSLTTILTNFDVLACGTSVMALSVHMRNLTMASATMDPADPQLDQQISQLREAIARLQALCNRYINDVPTGVATGANAGGAAAGGNDDATTAGAGGQTLNADERICRTRCEPYYSAYLDAKRDYDRALESAERARNNATQKRQDATQKANEATQAEREAEQARSNYDSLQREMTAATTQAERLRIAGEIARINPDSSRRWAEQKRSEANTAEQEATTAEQAATRAESRAGAKYVIMRDLYNEWKRCAEHCADQARRYSRVDVDIWSLFTLMPRTLPSPPPFYQPPAPPRPAIGDTRTSRLVVPPAALSGGMLAGVVLDQQDEEPDETRVAIDLPDGSQTETTTGAGGVFSISMPVAIGPMALAVPGTGGEEIALEVLDGVPEGLTAVPENYIAAGSPVMLGQPYRTVSVGNPGGMAGEVPLGTAVGADGTSGMTFFSMPVWVQPGAVEFNLVTAGGDEIVVESQVYTYLEAWLEQEKLRSGEQAQFGYQLDFGDGPGQVMMTIAITGPITYAKVGQPQVLQLDKEGRVTFTDHIQALQGSPAGTPFSIIPSFTRVN